MRIGARHLTYVLLLAAGTSISGCGLLGDHSGDVARVSTFPNSALLLTREDQVCADGRVIMGRPSETADRVVDAGQTAYFRATDYTLKWWCGGAQEAKRVVCPPATTMLRVTRPQKPEGGGFAIDCFAEYGDGSDDDPARVQGVVVASANREVCGNIFIRGKPPGNVVDVQRGRTRLMPPTRIDRLGWDCYMGQEGTQCPASATLARISRPQNGRDFYIDCFQ